MAKKKPDPVSTHTAALNMRLRPEHLDLFRRAASRAGLGLSGWVRERLLRAARQELGEQAVD